MISNFDDLDDKEKIELADLLVKNKCIKNAEEYYLFLKLGNIKEII